MIHQTIILNEQECNAVKNALIQHSLVFSDELVSGVADRIKVSRTQVKQGSGGI